MSITYLPDIPKGYMTEWVGEEIPDGWLLYIHENVEELNKHFDSELISDMLEWVTIKGINAIVKL